MNINIIKRHKEIMKLVRKECGEHNYYAQLDNIKTLLKFESDEYLKFLLEKEQEVLVLKIEKEQVLQNSDNTSETITIDDKEWLRIERNDCVYKVPGSKKNLVCYDALLYSLATNKTFDNLNADDYRTIGIKTHSGANNVRTILYRIVNGGKGSLSDKEKKFFVELLLAYGHSVGVMNKFPFLQISCASAS